MTIGIMKPTIYSTAQTLVDKLVPAVMREIYCTAMDFTLILLALCFWVNQLLIAIIRSIKSALLGFCISNHKHILG